MNENRVAELESALATEAERADRMLRLLNRQTQARMNLQQTSDRYAVDISEYRHALSHVLDCEDNCEQCRTLAGSTLDRTAEPDLAETSPIVFLHPPWQVQMERNPDGSYDIGLVLAGRSNRLSWHEATTLSVALKVAVENAATADDKSRVDANGVPADCDLPAPPESEWKVEPAQLIPLDPDWVVSPGAMLAEWAEDNQLTPRDAAARVNLGIAAYLDLEAGELALTEEIAEDLERGTDIKAELWLGMERIYREGLAAGKTHVSTVDGERRGIGDSELADPPSGGE